MRERRGAVAPWRGRAGRSWPPRGDRWGCGAPAGRRPLTGPADPQVYGHDVRLSAVVCTDGTA
jgi:hypothetical protein